jgi:hypothetical protein
VQANPGANSQLKCAPSVAPHSARGDARWLLAQLNTGLIQSLAAHANEQVLFAIPVDVPRAD